MIPTFEAKPGLVLKFFRQTPFWKRILSALVSLRRFCRNSVTQLVTVLTISRAALRAGLTSGLAVEPVLLPFLTIRILFFSDMSDCYALNIIKMMERMRSSETKAAIKVAIMASCVERSSSISLFSVRIFSSRPLSLPPPGRRGRDHLIQPSPLSLFHPFP